MLSVRRVGIVGAGAMGATIAVDFAIRGRPVTVRARTPDGVARLEREVRGHLDRLATAGVLGEPVPAVLARITATTELERAVAGQDLVVEAVIEDPAVKAELFAELDRLADPATVLASTSTAVPPAELAQDCAHPERVLVTRYARPAHLIPVVEVVPGEATAADVLTAMLAMLTELGKTPVTTPGPIGPRLLTALIGEGLRLVAEGVAEPETVDRVITGGIGRRLGVSGVFDRLDLAGLDTVAGVLERQGKPVPPMLAEKVAAGHAGRKAGQGFYGWSAEQAAAYDEREAEHLAGLLPRPEPAPPQAHTVLIEPGVLAEYLAEARAEYESCTPADPPRCFAVLVGSLGSDGIAAIERLHFAETVRDDDPSASLAWAESIVPCFGSAYENKRRGFWCGPDDLFRISRQADADGLDVLGSIHLHPDWHRIGPKHERGLTISEQPTPMDGFLFRNTGWPVNLICYLERVDDRLLHGLSGWAPPPYDDPARGCTQLAVRLPITG